ncbi:MAG: acyl-CoA synthetase [Actinomycetota bacterium]
MYPGRWAAERPDQPAVIMAGSAEVTTWADLDAASNRLAHALRSAGLHRGDHIALFMDNRVEFFHVAWAALRSGIYVTAVNSYLTAEEAGYIVDDCEARILITSVAKAEVAEAMVDHTPRLEQRIVVGGALAGHDAYEGVVAGQPHTPIDDESQGDAMLYSSGTTGRPKGIIRPLPERSLWEVPAAEQDARIAAMPYDYRPGMVYLSPAPLYHAAPFGFTIRTHQAGGAVVVMERFDPLGSLEAIERFRATHSQWVPTMFVRMLELSEEERSRHDLSTHEVAIHAAAPCPVPVKQQMMDWWGPIIHEYYAGTERIGATRIGPEEWLEHPGSVGQPVDGAVRIVDDDGNEVAAGVEGAIYVKGPDTGFSYKGDPEKTADTLLADGFGTYGDIGYVDEDGWLYLTDRKSHMIISGGVNIYPREAEDVLITHPAVADVAVFGIPHPDLGEEVKAAVEVAVGSEAGPALAAELVAFCRDNLTHYKCPRSIDFEDELPRLPTGKLYKRKLRDAYWDA